MLINDQFGGFLCDFGLSMFIKKSGPLAIESFTKGPELLEDRAQAYPSESDVEVASCFICGGTFDPLATSWPVTQRLSDQMF